jgi:hypothetical protein
MNTVRKLVLKKGGKYVAIQTYGILGRKMGKFCLSDNKNIYILCLCDSGNNKAFFNVPVVHCSGIQHTFYGKHRQAEYFSVVDPDP